MGIETWHIWIIIAMVLFIAELFTPAFLAACLGIGCLVAGLVSNLDFSIEIQLLSFSIGSLVGFFGVRPFMLKYAYGNEEKVKTNVEALIGKAGIVTVTLDKSKNEGRIIVEGVDWRAESADDQVLHVGEKVEVLRVNSTILIVKPITNL